MSFISSNNKSNLCNNEEVLSSDIIFFENYFPKIPTEVQYNIFEIIGGIGTQVSKLDKYPDIQNTIISRKVMNAYNFFSTEPEGSPTKIAFNEAAKSLNLDEKLSFISFEKITNLAFKNLLNMLKESERSYIEDTYGQYSLSLEKIRIIKQIISYPSLMIMWSKVKVKLEALHITDLPTSNNAKTIRKWLKENQAILQRVNELHIEDLRIIPHEISYFTGLTKLIINKGEIRYISPLKNLSNLEFLDVAENQIKDISPLKNLSNLEFLAVAKNQIKDISPLKNLHELESVVLAANQIKDLSSLKHLPNLRNLNVGQNEIRDISPLKNLSNLMRLDAWQNKIRDISPIQNLSNLMRLDVGQNEIRDISPLKNLSKLMRLDVGQNEIRDISPLKNLSKLKRLDAWQNKISDISPIQNLSNLMRLDVGQNEISDISPLKNLIGLRELSILKGNPIKYWEDLQNLEKLVYKGTGYNPRINTTEDNLRII